VARDRVRDGNFQLSKILDMSKCHRASFSPKDKAKRSKLKRENLPARVEFSDKLLFGVLSERFLRVAGIIDFIKNSIIPDANSPIISRTSQLMASGGAWNLGQCFNTGNDTIKNGARKRF